MAVITDDEQIHNPSAHNSFGFFDFTTTPEDLMTENFKDDNPDGKDIDWEGISKDLPAIARNAVKFLQDELPDFTISDEGTDGNSDDLIGGTFYFDSDANAPYLFTNVPSDRSFNDGQLEFTIDNQNGRMSMIADELLKGTECPDSKYLFDSGTLTFTISDPPEQFVKQIYKF